MSRTTKKYKKEKEMSVTARSIQNRPDYLTFTRPFNRNRIDLTLKWIYVKINVDTKSDYSQQKRNKVDYSELEARDPKSIQWPQ